MHDLDQWLQRSNHGPGFLKALEDKPDDPLIRMQFADALEEAGFHGAAMGMRWAAREGKRPEPAGDDAWGSVSGGWYAGTPGDRYPARLPPIFTTGKIPSAPNDPEFGHTNEIAGIWYRSARHGTSHNERDFLHRSNQLDWDEQGNPREKASES